MSSIKYSLMLQIAVLLLLHQVQGARIKLNIHQTDDNFYQRKSRQAESTACADRIAVSRQSLVLPEMLNMLDQRVLFYRSQYAKESLTAFINSATVPGLEPTTVVADVLAQLRNEGCPVYIYGGVVRDQFLGREPNDVDVEVECSISMVVTVCRQQWGEDNCGKETDKITHIGKILDPKAVDLAPTTSTFYASLSQLEYTANSLAYDTNGLDIIIDISGNGVEDVCAKKIRIPSDDNSEASWDLWKTASPQKIYRYWKLRSKTFTAYNGETQNYIVRSAKTLIDNDSDQFKRFYCDAVYGLSYNSMENSCPSTSEELCMSKSAIASTYRMVLDDDLSESYIEVLSLPRCGAMMLLVSPLLYIMTMMTLFANMN